MYGMFSAELRGRLTLSREYAQAILEYFYRTRLTKRIEDRHVLAKRDDAARDLYTVASRHYCGHGDPDADHDRSAGALRASLGAIGGDHPPGGYG